MKKKKKDDFQMPSSPGWMTTYGDMVTLLLTFFVLLISFSSIDTIKFGSAMYSLKGSLGVLKKHRSIVSDRADKPPKYDQLKKQGIYESVMEMEKIAKELGFEGDVSVEARSGGMLIQLGNRILFDLGKADLKQESFPLLDIVGKTIGNKAGEVLVCGHTDNIPIVTAEFPSNWELSTARALSVVNYFINVDTLSPEIFAAVGYSEYRPLVPNNSPENRRKNRRVEFLVTWE